MLKHALCHTAALVKQPNPRHQQQPSRARLAAALPISCASAIRRPLASALQHVQARRAVLLGLSAVAATLWAAKSHLRGAGEWLDQPAGSRGPLREGWRHRRRCRCCTPRLPRAALFALCGTAACEARLQAALQRQRAGRMMHAGLRRGPSTECLPPSPPAAAARAALATSSSTAASAPPRGWLGPSNPGVYAAMHSQDWLVDHLKRDGVVKHPEGGCWSGRWAAARSLRPLSLGRGKQQCEARCSAPLACCSQCGSGEPSRQERWRRRPASRLPPPLPLPASCSGARAAAVRPRALRGPRHPARIRLPGARPPSLRALAGGAAGRGSRGGAAAAALAAAPSAAAP